MSEQVIVPTDRGGMPAELWLPESGSGPGLVLFQEIFGVSAYIRRRAADLAALGYVVLAPEFYWRLPESGPVEGDGALEEAMARANAFDWAAGVADGAACIRHLRGDERTGGRVGAIGFCFGGGLAFNVAAVEPIDALVSYYGSALRGLLELAPQVNAPSIHHFGLADSYIDADAIGEIEAAVTAGGECEFWTYEGADHAFDNSDFFLHHADASALAWERTTAFLQRVLPVG